MTTRLTDGPMRIALLTSTMLVSLYGCTSMSGLGGSSDYACKAPEGVTCDSVSGTYANAIHHNLPSQRVRHPMDASDPSALRPRPPMQAVPRLVTPSQPPVTAQALRSQARVLRLWFKPWEDADHDLYDQGYVYVQIDSGQWLIDHMQRQIRDAYAPLRPPPRSAAAASQTDAKDRPPSQSSLVRPEFPQRPVSGLTTDSDTLLPPLGAPTDDKP